MELRKKHSAEARPKRYPCEECPLRRLSVFKPFTDLELDFVSQFKTGELTVERGATIFLEGNHNPHLYTVLMGMGFRYKVLADGRRQILNYVLPGDLIGLQGSLMGEMQHSVEALSPMMLCVFEREKLETLYRNHPDLAFDVTWLAAREEQMLDEHLLSVGQRTALERAAYLIAFLWTRTSAVMPKDEGAHELPITQRHLADTLGLSLVHTNKTVRKLAKRGLLRWQGGCEVIDVDGLVALSGWESMEQAKRPLV